MANKRRSFSDERCLTLDERTTTPKDIYGIIFIINNIQTHQVVEVVRRVPHEGLFVSVRDLDHWFI
jgi:hypothetical protein